MHLADKSGQPLAPDPDRGFVVMQCLMFQMSALGPGSCSGCGMAYSLSALHAQAEFRFATARVCNLIGFASPMTTRHDRR